MEKIKAAQIGCGGRNGAHFQKLSSFADVDIVGFCDIIPERAEARCKAYGSGKTYTDYVQMLDETKPDVVFIAVPPHVHGEIEPELIKRKIHFLVEKPMALDYSVAEHICDEAEKAGILTAVGFQDRYQSLTDIMKDYIKDKQIGLVSGGWLGGIPGVRGGEPSRPPAARSSSRTSTSSTSSAGSSVNPQKSSARPARASSIPKHTAFRATTYTTTPPRP